MRFFFATLSCSNFFLLIDGHVAAKRKHLGHESAFLATKVFQIKHFPHLIFIGAAAANERKQKTIKPDNVRFNNGSSYHWEQVV